MDRRTSHRQPGPARRILQRSAAGGGLVLALLALSAGAAHADHIPTAQEGLGAMWWGVAFLGVVGMVFIGTIAYTVVTLSRRENAREDGRDPS